jgi:gamma-glutamyltranspeptidase/glutathione hydrolase
VPGTVAGFALAHEKYGTGEWSAVVEPAVKLATEGWALPENLARALNSRVTNENALPGIVAGYAKDGVPWEAGETITLPILGRTLAKIRDEGRDAFYGGEVAQLIVDEMGRGNGIITLEDLERYQAVEREPIRGTFRDYDIISMPPPSSGGIAIVEMLNIVEGFDLKAMGHYSAEYLHHTTEAARRAYRDRAVAIADTDFFPVPVARLTSKEYAAELRETIDSEQASVSQAEDILDFKESDETTHYSVVDKNGMAVSVTYTLEGGYGSGIVVEGGGFFLNNEMGDFNAGPGITTATGLIGTDANLARPEQRMLSSMSPTIIAKDGQLVAVIGSPGGRTIINTVFHLALSIMEFEMDIESAVAAKRANHQWLPDRLSVEADTPEEVVAQLEAMGHEVRVGRGQGSAHSIGVTSDGRVIGVPDPRSGPTAGASPGG